MDWQSFKSGDLVWFDPNNSGFHIPGEIQEVHNAAQVLIVGAHIDGKVSRSLPERCHIHTMLLSVTLLTKYIIFISLV